MCAVLSSLGGFPSFRLSYPSHLFLSVVSRNLSVAFASLSVTSAGLFVALSSFRRFEDFSVDPGNPSVAFAFYPSLPLDYPSPLFLSVVSKTFSVDPGNPSVAFAFYPSPFLLFVDPRKLSLAFTLLSVTLKSLSILLINSSNVYDQISFFFPQKYSQHEADYMLIDMNVWFLFAGILNDQCLWAVY